VSKVGPALVTLPNGLTVFARGLRRQGPADPLPEFGLYLLGHDPQTPPFTARITGLRALHPSWEWQRIEWPDFGTPADTASASVSIVETYARIQQRQRVEVACGGGIGRTGTVLACLAVLAGEHGSEAVEWVRENYHPKAVETAKQAVWVQRFWESLLREDLGE
jgi:protein-tyrosine phosphatase